MTASVYGAAAPAYREAGWLGVLPIRPGEKTPVAPGFHGTKARGIYPSDAKVRGWSRLASTTGANIALRPPEEVIGIDVDAYDGKAGSAALAEAESRWGPLPPTWRSTSRPDDEVSGIRWFRVAPGLEWRDVKRSLSLEDSSKGTWSDVETIWWGNRYGVVWPSLHPEGRRYVWFNPAGEVAERVPSPDELADLPSGWVTGLTREPEPQRAPLERASHSPALPVAGRPSEFAPNQTEWVERGIAARLADIAKATGARNESLNEHALRVWRLWLTGASRLTEAEVENELLEAVAATGYLRSDGEGAAIKTIRSAKDGAMRHGPATNLPEPAWRAEREDDPGAWAPLDLGAWFTSPPPPAERFGSGGLLYRGGLHWLAGEPEAGKSILMLHWALEEMRLGHNVVLLDEEAGARDVFAKMQALGATPDLLAERLTYLPPAGRNVVREAKELRRVVEATRATFVGVDGAAAHLAIADLNEDSAGDVTKFAVRSLLPLAHDLGAAVIVLDHMTKTLTNNRYARGSGAKLAKADAAYYVEAKQPFSKGSSGLVQITSTKDRFGEFGRGANWSVQVEAEAGLRLSFSRLTKDDAAEIAARVAGGPNAKRDAKVRTELVSFLRANPGASLRMVRDSKIAGKDVLDRVIAGLKESDDLIVKHEKNGSRHFLNEQQSLAVHQ